jgi:hypothetical protein
MKHERKESNRVSGLRPIVRGPTQRNQPAASPKLPSRSAREYLGERCRAVVAISAAEQFDEVVAERPGDLVPYKHLQLGSHLTVVAFGDRLDDDLGEFVIERWADVEK